MMPTGVETAIGLHGRPAGALADVAAGATSSIAVVADGMGGHGTGWLGSRRVVRALVEALGGADRAPAFVGAASDAGLAEARRRWMGGDAEALLPSSLPRDLVEAFVALEPALTLAWKATPTLLLTVGCVAATFDGARVHGAHAGAGRAMVVRASADRPEDLVVPHFLDRVAARSEHHRDIDPAEIPPNIIANALGVLTQCGIGVDRFDVTLDPGDVLVLCSRALELDDAALCALVHAHAGEPIATLAQAIEAAGPARGCLAFALARPPDHD